MGSSRRYAYCKENIRSPKKIETKIFLPDEFHLKIEYTGVSVEFVASFIIKPNSNVFEYNILPEMISYRDYEDKLQIPCTPLEDWYIIYRLLKRDDKANLIKNFLLNKRTISQKVFNKSLKCNIPKYLKKDIKCLLDEYYKGLQLSLFDLDK